MLLQNKSAVYTTVQEMYKTLADKVYADFRNDVRQSDLKNLLNRFFDNSWELLAQYLIRETDIELKDLDALQKESTKRTERGHPMPFELNLFSRLLKKYFPAAC